MGKLRIIFLLLSSLLFSSCAYHKLASYKKQSEVLVNFNNLNPLIPPAKAVKYKASIDILNKHFTGLIILKQTDSYTKHLVFVTELGMRMFDFEISGDSIHPVFVFDPLNKAKLINALQRNFETILLLKWYDKKAEVRVKSGKEVLHLTNNKHHCFLFKSAENDAVIQQVFNGHKQETKTMYSQGYQTIKLKQNGIVKLFIELEKINE